MFDFFMARVTLIADFLRMTIFLAKSQFPKDL